MANLSGCFGEIKSRFQSQRQALGLQAIPVESGLPCALSPHPA